MRPEQISPEMIRQAIGNLGPIAEREEELGDTLAGRVKGIKRRIELVARTIEKRVGHNSPIVILDTTTSSDFGPYVYIGQIEYHLMKVFTSERGMVEIELPDPAPWMRNHSPGKRKVMMPAPNSSRRIAPTAYTSRSIIRLGISQLTPPSMNRSIPISSYNRTGPANQQRPLGINLAGLPVYGNWLYQESINDPLIERGIVDPYNLSQDELQKIRFLLLSIPETVALIDQAASDSILNF